MFEYYGGKKEAPEHNCDDHIKEIVFRTDDIGGAIEEEYHYCELCNRIKYCWTYGYVQIQDYHTAGSKEEWESWQS